MFDWLAAIWMRCWNVLEAPASLPCNAPDQAPRAESADVAQLQGLVGEVVLLTSSVAHDVGRHSGSVQAISAELSAGNGNDAAGVAALVCRLLLANQELQARLEQCESALHLHARQLQETATFARTDALTGLLNRRALDEELNRYHSEYVLRGQAAALVMLDVDHFKEFNDTQGHVVGDQALVHVADVLREHAGERDLVARYGGEEFVVVFAGADQETARTRAEALQRAVGQRPANLDGRALSITASAGLAELGPGETASEWLKRADAALYAAKQAGRNCAFAMRGTVCVPLAGGSALQESMSLDRPAPPRPLGEAAAELAADAFADTSFVAGVARGIAQWRCGGETLTVVLVRISRRAADASEPAPLAIDCRQLAGEAKRDDLGETALATAWLDDGLALLLPGIGAAQARPIARRLLARLVERADGRQTNADISIGLAEGIEGNDAQRVLERAWLALEAARHAGGAIYLHDGVKTAPVKAMLAGVR
jgi:diguanylate cyclase (GGDEF)-like protein